MMGEAVEPGSITTRAELKVAFGGGTQGGIVPSRSTPNVLIYPDPAAGEQSGYFDGWLPNDDDLGPVFEYTGHGEDDQTFVGNKGIGNRAILHLDEGRALRVFKAAGTVPGSDTKRQRYIGKFVLDPSVSGSSETGGDEAQQNASGDRLPVPPERPLPAAGRGHHPTRGGN